jgi:hypothetical protein
LALAAIWGIRQNISSGTASSRGWTCTIDDNPIGFCLIGCGKAVCLGFSITMILHAFGLAGEPVAPISNTRCRFFPDRRSRKAAGSRSAAGGGARPLSGMTLKNRIQRHPRDHQCRVAPADLQKLVMQRSSDTPENIGRRLRELAQQGQLEVMDIANHARDRWAESNQSCQDAGTIRATRFGCGHEGVATHHV